MARLLTAPEAAKVLGIAAYSLHRMAQRGDIPYRRVGRFWLFSERAVQQLHERLEKRRAEKRAHAEKLHEIATLNACII